TVGKVENCQSGVLLGDASRLGQALLDRELYLPEEWTDDRERCRKAGIPDDRRFMTKPQLAQPLVQRALAAGIPAKSRTGDRVSGDARRLRMGLEAQPQADVLAVSGTEDVWLDWRQRQVKTILASLPAEGGPGCVPAPAPRGPAGRIGAGCPWPTPWSPPGAGGCWSAAVSTTRGSGRPPGSGGLQGVGQGPKVRRA